MVYVLTFKYPQLNLPSEPEYKCQLKILKKLELEFSKYEEKCSIVNEIIDNDIIATRIKKRMHSKSEYLDILSEKIFELEVFS